MIRAVILSRPMLPVMYTLILVVVLAHYAWWSWLGVLHEVRRA